MSLIKVSVCSVLFHSNVTLTLIISSHYYHAFFSSVKYIIVSVYSLNDILKRYSIVVP